MTNNAHKWMTANNKAQRIEQLIRAKLKERGWDVSEDAKIVSGAVFLLTVKAAKDIKGNPSGRIHVIFGEPGERQVIPIRENETNIDGIIEAMGIFLVRKKKAADEDIERKRVREQDEKIAMELCEELTGRYLSTEGEIFASFGNNVVVNVKSGKISIVVNDLAPEQVTNLVKELRSYGFLKGEEA